MWTVVDDNDVLQVRASISDNKELEAVIECLQSHRDKFKTEQKEEKDE